MWSPGTNLAACCGRLAALLVSRHFPRLAGRREGLRALIDREEGRQAALTAMLALDADVLAACSDLLARWDGISLDLCGRREPDLDPWPFAPDELTLRFDARELPRGAVETIEVTLTRS